MTGADASRAREWALVLGGFAALAGLAAAWLAIDTRPPEWDHANHLERTVHCARDLAAGDLRALLERSSFYPPLVLCTAALAYLIAPSDLAAAQSVVLAFLGLGMVATYRLGRRLAGGTAGVVAALVFGTAPFVVFSSLRFQLDLPLAAMVAGTLVLLLRAEGFGERTWSLAAGALFGLGMLAKPPFAVYVLPPAAVVALGIRSRRAALNLGLAVLLAIAIALPWYGMRVFGMAFQVTSRAFAHAAAEGDPEALSWASLIWYPRMFATQFGVAAALLFVVGLCIVAWRRQWFVLAAFLVPFVAFELVQNKDLRYTLPLLPVAAVVAGFGLDAIRGRWRVVGGVVLVAFAAIQLSATLAGVPARWRVPLVGQPLVLRSPPTRADWRHREILHLIARDSGGAPGTVSVVPNHGFFSASNFRYFAVREGLPSRWSGPWRDAPLNIDYVIQKSGHQGPAFAAEKSHRVNRQFASDPFLAAAFPAIGEFPLPDGSLATVRVRRPPPVVGTAAAQLARRIEAGAAGLLGDFVAEAAGLRVGLDYEDAELLAGTIRRVTLSAASARVGELRRANAATMSLHGVRVVLEGFSVNPGRAAATGRLEPLALERVRLERLTVTEADLQAFLSALRRLRHSRIALLDDAADVHIVGRGPDVDVRVSVRPGRGARPIVFDARAVRVAGMAVPDALTGWVVRHFDPTLRWARQSVTVEVAPVRIRRGVLEVGAP